MNSISRAVTAKISEISNKRQRLVTEKEKIDFAENPSWSEISSPEQEFNYFDPPNIVIPEQDWRETPILAASSEQKSPKSPNAIRKKMSNVVRKLSPFNNNSKEEKPAEPEISEPIPEKKKFFKETREKVEKIKKSFKSKEQQQLIESEDEQS